MGTTSVYKGRFAPSPSGELHFGSLVTALASYLQAKSQKGQWEVRIEDIDPPREIKGSAEKILKTLQTFGLEWDNKVIYQSQHSLLYDKVLNKLHADKLSYACHCSRRLIQKTQGIYQNSCRNKQLTLKNNALRINLEGVSSALTFTDQLQGNIIFPHLIDDFILKRSDGLYAYNLAVVVDDIEQEITEIVRGADLLETTGKQLALYQLLGVPPPNYLHVPLVVDTEGRKLSKQNHAASLNIDNPTAELIKALRFLGVVLPKNASFKHCKEILEWAIKNWSVDNIPMQALSKK